MTVWAGFVLCFSGVRVVIPDRVFRSPQFSQRDLKTAIDDLGIRTVLNLRGRGGGRSWYGDERAVCEGEGVTHLTVTFDVDERAPRPVTLRFLEAIDGAAPPILMHCYRGVDRTGWAAAFVMLAQGYSLEESERQLSPVYGHLCLHSRCPQHHFFEAYRLWLGASGQVHSDVVFRRWVAEKYCPDPWNAVIKSEDDLPNSFGTKSEVALLIEVNNRGREAWSTSGSSIRLGVRMIGPMDSIPADMVSLFLDRQTRILDLARADIPGDTLDAGDSRAFQLKFRAPDQPGRYLIQVDMLKEHVHWFSEMGWPGLVWPVEILKHEDGES